VHGHVDARLQAIAQTVPAISVAGNLQPAAMRFLDNHLVFFERQRGDVDHLAIGQERAGSRRFRQSPALVIFGLVNFDPIDAVV